MPRIFIGKVTAEHPQQIHENFYAGGPRDSTWYGDLKEGDYVFPVFNGDVSKLWRAREFSTKPNSVNGTQGAFYFDEVKKLPQALGIAYEFSRSNAFEIDLSILVKSIKQFKVAFFELTQSVECPAPD